VDYVDPEHTTDDENINFLFKPHLGDFLMKVKEKSSDKTIFVWRVILTDQKIKKMWPVENDNIDCDHKDLYWAIDFEKRFITLCNDCQNFAFGHKVIEDE
jgi:hypothetical protein